METDEREEGSLGLEKWDSAAVGFPSPFLLVGFSGSGSLRRSRGGSGSLRRMCLVWWEVPAEPRIYRWDETNVAVGGGGGLR